MSEYYQIAYSNRKTEDEKTEKKTGSTREVEPVFVFRIPERDPFAGDQKNGMMLTPPFTSAPLIWTLAS